MRKICITLIMILAAIILVSTPLGAEEWVPYNPKGDDIAVNYAFNENISITVTIKFPHSGFTVHEGPIEVCGDIAKAYIDVMMWTGPAAQVITYKSLTWQLSSNVRIFELYINGQLVKSVQLNMTSQFRDYLIIPALAGILAIVVRLLALRT